MKPEQFCYWLQGYVEMGGEAPTPEQWAMIVAHLNTVFVNVTKPSDNVSDTDPVYTEAREEGNEVSDNKIEDVINDLLDVFTTDKDNIKPSDLLKPFVDRMVPTDKQYKPGALYDLETLGKMFKNRKNSPLMC